MLYIGSKKDFLKNLCILFCFVQLKIILINPLCVLDLFSEHWQSTLFQIFFFFFNIHSVFVVIGVFFSAQCCLVHLASVPSLHQVSSNKNTSSPPV